LRVQLANDAVAAVLERPGAGLSVLCLRPVVSPDLDGAVTGVVLARLAAEVRSSELAPGWIRVREDPPLLEMAAPSDGISELVEALQGALDRIAEDRRAVELQAIDARRRALGLMAEVLGVSEGAEIVPAQLLDARNLALGVVAPDAETAVEALHKFRVGGEVQLARPVTGAVAPVPRTREAAPGEVSVLVIGLDLDPSTPETRSLVVSKVLEERARVTLEDLGIEVLRPLVPGRSLVLLVISGRASLDDLEERVAEVWTRLTEAPSDDALEGVRRRLAAALAAANSGPLGSARRCADLAAGAAAWRMSADLELEILTMPAEIIGESLRQVPPFEDLLTTGAGVLPIPEIPPSD
jgi:hypothetical protein